MGMLYVFVGKALHFVVCSDNKWEDLQGEVWCHGMHLKYFCILLSAVESLIVALHYHQHCHQMHTCIAKHSLVAIAHLPMCTKAIPLKLSVPVA
jgi:hypothetical protein